MDGLMNLNLACCQVSLLSSVAVPKFKLAANQPQVDLFAGFQISS